MLPRIASLESMRETMDAHRWQRLKSVLADALECESTTARLALVERSCADDTTLWRNAKLLLTEWDADSAVDLEACAVNAPSRPTDVDQYIGKRIGAYVVTRKLGEGGMGMVYLARRADGCFEKQVAIKLLRDGASSEELADRFQAEREVLARLEHPNIARLIDAGATDNGNPYFVMEYVEGIPIVHFVEKEQLPVRARLELFSRVCRAVAAAHRNGVIHRDIKPSNILVNQDGEPKLLDFGIAKLMENVSDVHQQTAFGKERLTPIFASPEQLRGEQVTVVSDVYSLGVVLYEILTDQAPFRFDIDNLTGSELTRLIECELPVAPSLMVSDHERRRFLHGDLDSILLRSLQKEPAQRYPSVTEFADDIQNYLEGRVVRTRSREKLYRARHFLFKNKQARIGFAAALVLLCIAGSTILPSLLGIRSKAVDSRKASSAPAKSIAVLPFDRFSNDNDNRYLADGIQDNILTDLAQVADLKVIGRTSVAGFRTNKMSSEEIGKALGVAYLLEGSVSKSANRIRINAKLIEADSGLQVWAQSYERKLEDLFALQSELAQTIASQLKTTLSVDQKAAMELRPTQNMEAYDFYLRARESFFQANWSNALLLLDEAIARDRDFALAYCLAAESHLYVYRFGQEQTPARLAQARAAADKALQLAPDLPASHLAQAQYYYYGPRDYEKVLRELAAVSPSMRDSAKFIDLAALTERRLGRWKDAIQHGERAFELDPHNPYIANELVESYSRVRRFSDAEQLADKAIKRLAPSNGYLWRLKSQALLGRGLLDKARATLAQAPLFTENRAIDLAQLDLLARDFDQATERLAHAQPPEKDSSDLLMLDGFIAQVSNDSQRASSSYQRARKKLLYALAARPNDPFMLANIAIVDAGLGRKKEAWEEARRAVDLVPIARDAVDGPVLIKQLAWVYAMTGEYEAAFDQLSKIIAIPGGPSATELRLDPVWDGVRSQPKFQEMVQRAEQPPVYE